MGSWTIKVARGHTDTAHRQEESEADGWRALLDEHQEEQGTTCVYAREVSAACACATPSARATVTQLARMRPRNRSGQRSEQGQATSRAAYCVYARSAVPHRSVGRSIDHMLERTNGLGGRKAGSGMRNILPPVHV